jgi:hypothetical protein
MADAAQGRIVQAILAGGEAGGEHGSFGSVVPLLFLFLYACLYSPISFACIWSASNCSDVSSSNKDQLPHNDFVSLVFHVISS